MPCIESRSRIVDRVDLSFLWRGNWSVNSCVSTSPYRVDFADKSVESFVNNLIHLPRDWQCLDERTKSQNHCRHCFRVKSTCFCHCTNHNMCLICKKGLAKATPLFMKMQWSKLLRCRVKGVPCKSCRFSMLILFGHLWEDILGEQYIASHAYENIMDDATEHTWKMCEKIGLSTIDVSIEDIFKAVNSSATHEYLQVGPVTFSTESKPSKDNSIIVWKSMEEFLIECCRCNYDPTLHDVESSVGVESSGSQSFGPFMSPVENSCIYVFEFPYWIHEWFIRTPGSGTVDDTLRLSSLSILINTVPGCSLHHLQSLFKMAKNDVLDFEQSVMADKDQWVQQISNEACQALNSFDGSVQKFELGQLYGYKDLWVTKSCLQNIAVNSGQACELVPLIENKERQLMKKRYMAVHLDGIEINCQSYLPPGARGICFVSLYDNRFLKPGEGFLGMAMFSLSKRLGVAKMKINYSISTQDELNWTVVISVIDHGLHDCLRPCNVALKSVYKYTNHAERFAEQGRGVDKPFYFAISSDDTTLAESSMRQAIDYSCDQFLKERLTADLSKREKSVLRQRRRQNLARNIMFRNQAEEDEEERDFFEKPNVPPPRRSDCGLSEASCSSSAKPVNPPYIAVKSDEEVYKDLMLKQAEHQRLKAESNNSLLGVNPI